MCQMNVLEAKTNFSKIILMLENREEDEVIIARHGKPVVKVTLIPQEDISKRIGIAEGQLVYPDDFDEMNDEIAKLFGVE